MGCWAAALLKESPSSAARSGGPRRDDGLILPGPHQPLTPGLPSSPDDVVLWGFLFEPPPEVVAVLELLRAGVPKTTLGWTVCQKDC